jgi:parallel beta-helix repeat protein
MSYPTRCMHVGLLSFFAAIPFLLSVTAAAQNTIHVPSDQATIQAAINVAYTGDTVLVAPGTYHENISFNGKAITVTSSGGAAQTIIDGGSTGPVVTFNTNEASSSTFNGFTLQHGISTANSLYMGAGVYVYFASPTIQNNIIQNNNGCNGGGIGVYYGSPIIRGNTIRSNTMNACSGGTGAISVGGPGSTRIIGNIIQNNTASMGSCGGISLDGGSSTTIQNNIISGNAVSGLSPASVGGGICMWNILPSMSPANALIIQNLIYGNTAGQGGGIYAFVPSGARPLFLNNTIVGSSNSPQGSAVYITGYDDQAQFINNLMIGASGTNAVYCDSSYDQTSPSSTNNDAYSTNGTGLQGTCSGESSHNGNISVDPLFVNAATSDFHLQPTSPPIDAGTNAAPNLPQTDFAGNPRILDGNNDCVSTVDMGAYELVLTANATMSANALNFGSQVLGTSSAAQPVTLSNTGSTCFQFSSVAINGDFSEGNNCAAAGVSGGGSCTYSVVFSPTTTGTRSGALTVSGSDGVTTKSLNVSLNGSGGDFSVSASPTAATVKHAQSVKFSISLNPVGGTFNSSVALACSGLPTGATCSFSPSSVIPGTNGASATLTLGTSGKTPRGTFNVVIVGTIGNAQRTTTVRVTVN